MEKVRQIQHVPYDNLNVIIGSSSEGNGQVKIFTSQNLDHIHSFDDGNCGPVAAILMTEEGFSKVNKKSAEVQMIVYKSGFIKVIHIRTLKEHSYWNLDNMEAGEEITCGSFNSACNNFVLGTNQGSLYVGHYI